MRNETLNTTTGQSWPIHKHLVCWRSTIAGLVVALFTYMTVLALAIAFGGIGLSDGATAANAGLFTGISVALATIIATFVGAYFAVRMGRTKVDTLGSSQGFLVGALFSMFVIFQVLSLAKTIGEATAKTLGASAVAAGTGAAAASDSSLVQQIVEDNFGDMKLKSPPSDVARGVASRLIRDDAESAKNYLAGQAGISPEEADQKIAQAKAKLQEGMVKTRQAAATALKTTGWSLFVLLVLSFSASSVGGLLGTKCNERWTLDTPDELKKRRV